jgi:hypothetical protein
VEHGTSLLLELDGLAVERAVLGLDGARVVHVIARKRRLRRARVRVKRS